MDAELSQENLEWLRLTTEYVATVVRNAMADFHHKYLSNEQMEELNPIIRNAIFTALYTQETFHESEQSEAFVTWQFSSVLECWEEPELTASFKKCILGL